MMRRFTYRPETSPPRPVQVCTRHRDVPPFTEGDEGREYLDRQAAEAGERYEKAGGEPQ